MTGKEWDVATYQRFSDLRLRPARDLAAAIGILPQGDIVDLGCGAGSAAPLLRARWPDRRLIGMDASEAMLTKAEGYDDLNHADIANWRPDTPPALIFSNAVLQWVPDHSSLFPRLVQMLRPGGWLGVQMPRQTDGASHRLIREVAAHLFPDRFNYTDWQPPVVPPEAIWPVLASLGQVDLWETAYIQPLAAQANGHPVRHFTQSTACRPVLDQLDPSETARFFAAYDAALAVAYPVQSDGRVLFPFLRQFFTIQVT
ncbi:trans-aconitate 2-methyltransferase [Rubricella aquisinus]|uniref:Trans-aconitate 2-methyltransferase n=1 Tax=Rubricella aquisinus TaxID=2028108 RepID=A0A840WPE9_9RHOB|nr:methyltransferase domain-containing protein [Rubricella aquisinus]MBB5515953.1 trans-aconitate 2-methyltransferase [Rubricella aquisinus]